MKRIRQQVQAWVAGLVLVAGAFAWGADEYTFPTLRVPKLAKAPVLDGTIAAGEWDRAAAFTGITSDALGGGIVPNIQQVVFYLGYDDKYLYLGMRSPHQEGRYPKARCKQNDSWEVLFEDHIEFQLLKHARKLATRPGFGFYKMLVNPRGAIEDKWWFNGTDGSELLWSTGGLTKCSVTPTYWDLEMSVEIAQLDEKSLDGKDWVMQLVRSDSCGGVYYAGWAPGTWLAWDKFPQVVFDPECAAVQLLSLGELMEGNLDARLALASDAGKPHQATVSFRVLNATKRELFAEEKTVTVPARGRTEFGFARKGLALDDQGNLFILEAREGDNVLYRIQAPVTKLTAAYRTKYLEPWLAGRPQSGEWEYAFAYLPYSNVANCSVDLDFFGVPAAIQAATGFRVDVKDGAGKSLVSGEAKIDTLLGRLLLKLPELADGQYQATFVLMNGDAELARKEVEFVRKHYPWERNRLGISDEVIPPYEPIVVKQGAGTGPALGFWSRWYQIGPGALPAGITVSHRSLAMHNVPLLRAPARLELRGNGKLLEPGPGDVDVVSAAEAEVKLIGTRAYGPVSVATDATAEYDGWYETALTFDAPAGTNLDSADLVLELGAYADTLYVHRGGDGRQGNYFGAVPDGTGTVWQSSQLPTYKQGGKNWSSFVPVVFVGTGSRGLWFFSWSDKGWQLQDDDAAVRLERDAQGKVNLRVRFLAGGVTFDRPRTVRFALLAAPVKPLPENYRNWPMNHDTSGYRYYGDSVDGFSLPDDTHYELLRRFLLYGPQTPLALKDRPYAKGRTRGNSMIQGLPNVLYGSTYMTGLGMEEFDTFGGEWLLKSNWQPRPDLKFSGRPNYSGSVVWDTPRKMSPVGINYTPSMADAFVWYHQKLMQVGVNGTWLDNCSIGTLELYDPELGRMDRVFNTKLRRDLMKRCSVAGWQAMRAPCWVSNLHDEFSWTQTMWLVENAWYISAEGMDYLDHMSVDEFRAMACPKSMQLPTKPWLHGGSAKSLPAEVNEHIERSKWGICLLHDVHGNLPEQVRRELNYFLDFESASRCVFRGYWDTPSALVDPGRAAVKASLYQNVKRRNVVVVLLNTGEQEVELSGLSFDRKLIDGELARAFDAESGTALPCELRNRRYVLGAGLAVKRHGVRLLALSGE